MPGLDRNEWSQYLHGKSSTYNFSYNNAPPALNASTASNVSTGQMPPMPPMPQMQSMQSMQSMQPMPPMQSRQSSNTRMKNRRQSAGRRYKLRYTLRNRKHRKHRKHRRHSKVRIPCK